MSISEILLLIALLASLYYIIFEDPTSDFGYIPRFARVQIRAQVCWDLVWG